MATKRNLLQELFGALGAQPAASIASTPAVPNPELVSAALSAPQATPADPAPAAPAPPLAIDMNALIQTMISANLTLIDRFVTFLQKLQSEVMSAPQGTLNGETEELLRLLIQSAQKSIEALIALHERLQTKIIESYFPAQD